jgi:SAM-dependent methyltransferase
LIDLIRKRFRNTFVGQRFFDDMARTYSASRIVFNRSIANDVNMRVFEALASGSLLMTNDLSTNGQAELFQDGIHLATYTHPEEMLDKIAYYLAHEPIRERIAAAGRQEAFAKHTYRHRMETLLREVETALAARESWVPAQPVPERVFPTETPFPPQGVADDRGKDCRSAAQAQEVQAQDIARLELVPLAKDQSDLDDLSYFEFARPELVALVPLTARRILDVGCGAGRLGEAIKARQAAEVVGIEYVEAAGLSARRRLDQVLIGDIEKLELPFTTATFDAIICGDVLEHLREPERILREACGWLRPGGVLIASIPNVRHHSVVRSLLNGNWTYESAGLLDKTHLHFFTRRDIEELLHGAGLRIAQMGFVPGPGHQEWVECGRPGQVGLGPLRIQGLPREEAEEFFVYQYLVVAEPAANGDRGMTDGQSVLQGQKRQETDPATRRLRIMFLGDFGSSWRHETQAADALEKEGHAVSRFHEYDMASVDQVVAELNSGRYDCLLFYKGRIGAHSVAEVFDNTGEAIAEVIRRAKVPCYTWYVDRAYEFSFQPSREEWMRRVAPLCRVAFVADGPLTKTSWGRWHILREPISPETARKIDSAEESRKDLAFIGELYGTRADELAPVQVAFPVDMISGVYGADLSPVIRSYRIILGPRYPTVPGYWGNRIYVVLGHGGFFLAPEVEGMREEGFVPGVHYAALGDDPVADIRYWLARPAERERMARAGQELVLSRFTYQRAVRELCGVIGKTLSEAAPTSGHADLQPSPVSTRTQKEATTMKEESLDAIALRCETDKSSRAHHYTRHYERHFGPMRDKPVRLLEMGVGEGGSLRMWRDYFANGRIFGLEMETGKHPELSAITIFQGSQTDEKLLATIAGETGGFDIVIDDASHRWSDQIASFKALFPHVRAGGYYVIEDLHTSYWEKYRSGGQSTIAFLKELVDDVNLHGKSGYGTPINDPEFRALQRSLTDLQRTIESITFYKSIVFVRKKGADGN